MKIIKQLISCAIVALLSISCGEDRTYQYLELTKENQWIYSTMKSNYLWADSIKEPSRNDFFSKNRDFFNKLLTKEDKTSYFSDSALLTSYGMSFAIMRDPLGIKPSDTYALVLFVEPHSPADNAGVKRGTWISQVGKNTITTNNYGYLERGGSTTLHTKRIITQEEAPYYCWADGDTLTMKQATTLNSSALYMDTIYNLRNHKIGYLVYNRFDQKNSADETITALQRMHSQGITDLIIDLRYNSGGSLETATKIASTLVPPTATGKIFCKLEGNKENSKTYTYEETSQHLETRTTYLLTTKATRGAAEAFAAALQNTIGNDKVIIVGENTAGDNLYTQTIESPYNFNISPATGNLYTANGNALPNNGLHTNYTLNELAYFYKIYEIGEEQEYMLYNTMYLITYGTLPQNSNRHNINNPIKTHHIEQGKSILQ